MCFPLTSIHKKQIVAATGLLLILFVIVHLLGNLVIYMGPEAFNAYAKKLASLKQIRILAELGLGAIFLTHIYFTALLVHENVKARGGAQRYAVDQAVGQRSLFTRLMPISGLYIFGFVIWHILDFTLIDHHGVRSMINGISYGVYGVVVNAFKDPVHSSLYIIAVIFLGMHLAHGCQSVVQTFGLEQARSGKRFIVFSRITGFLVAFGFTSIPLYVLFIL